jgi:hypothetical protein
MQVPQFSMKPLANHHTVTHNHSSDKRIGTDSPTPALSKLASPPQVGFIRACELCIHRTD